MTFTNILYTLLIGPLQLLFEIIFSCANKVTENPGLTIISLSLSMNFLILPLYMRADALQEEEKNIEMKLADGVAHIKKTFKGDERMMMLQTYYRQNDYKPTYVLRGATSLFLEIPFFIAAYHFLSTLPIIEGVAFGPIADLGKPDALIHVGGITLNILPVIMTLINAISTAIFTKGYPRKTKIQLYSMALFFLVFLYTSPAGLVFYWTLNNLFSLVKTIFYKLKHAKQILIGMASAAGLVSIIFGIRYVGISISRLALFTLVGLLLQIPVASVLFKMVSIKKNGKSIFATAKNDSRESTNNSVGATSDTTETIGVNAERQNGSSTKIFILSALLLAVLMGLLIPSAVIKTSPLEFVNLAAYYNPLWYILSAALLSVGTFLIWINVFYRLSNNKGKILIENILCIIAVTCTINYMFFGKGLGTLLPSLRYENGMVYSSKEMLFNLAAIALVALILIALLIFKKKICESLVLISVLAFSIMAFLNINSIKNEVNAVVEQNAASTEIAHFNMSKNGKNVIVMMLDRAMGEYVPYIMSEKPELMEAFDGFTYYENTISYGGHTNFASPALFGGYEYTPEAINLRADEALVDKQNEALKVMPLIFKENGYDVTVCDPAYAGYQWIPDLSIYSDYPEIHAYNTKGVFVNEEANAANKKAKERNFFCYALVKSMPLCIQPTLYEEANYHNLSAVDMSAQTVKSLYVADGLNEEFENAYAVLENLPAITTVVDDSSDNFLMITNDTTHEPALLQKDEQNNYFPSAHVDNTEYGEEDKNASEIFGDAANRTLVTTGYDQQIMMYHSTMAAFKALGNWFDYLRENGLYDNTRIILVADHGHGLEQLDDLMLYVDDEDVRLEYFFPLLMEKDFNKTGFDVSDKFMTNADTPSMAFEGIIDNAVNPFTSQNIGDYATAQKNEGTQYVFESDYWETKDNNGNTFRPGRWISVDTSDIWNKDNWKINVENAEKPVR